MFIYKMQMYIIAFKMKPSSFNTLKKNKKKSERKIGRFDKTEEEYACKLLHHLFDRQMAGFLGLNYRVV